MSKDIWLINTDTHVDQVRREPPGPNDHEHAAIAHYRLVDPSEPDLRALLKEAKEMAWLYSRNSLAARAFLEKLEEVKL